MQADEAAEELSGVEDDPTAWLPVGQKGRYTQNTGKRILVSRKFGLVLPNTRFGLDLQFTSSHEDPCVGWEYELAVRVEDGRRSGLPLSASLASEAADLQGHASAWSVGPVLCVVALQ